MRLTRDVLQKIFYFVARVNMNQLKAVTDLVMMSKLLLESDKSIREAAQLSETFTNCKPMSEFFLSSLLKRIVKHSEFARVVVLPPSDQIYPNKYSLHVYILDTDLTVSSTSSKKRWPAYKNKSRAYKLNKLLATDIYQELPFTPNPDLKFANECDLGIKEFGMSIGQHFGYFMYNEKDVDLQVQLHFVSAL